MRFEAGDGTPASALRLGADPVNTPGWSIRPGWQGCATVEGSDSCSLTLVFAPSLVLGPGTLSLPYTYVDNLGEARSGSVDIDYASRLYEAYIADYSDDAQAASGYARWTRMAACRIARPRRSTCRDRVAASAMFWPTAARLMFQAGRLATAVRCSCAPWRLMAR